MKQIPRITSDENIEAKLLTVEFEGVAYQALVAEIRSKCSVSISANGCALAFGWFRDGSIQNLIGGGVPKQVIFSLEDAIDF